MVGIKEGFPAGSDGKESACNAGDLGSVLGLGRSPGEGNAYIFRYSCLGIPWTEESGSRILNVTKSQTQDRT